MKSETFKQELEARLKKREENIEKNPDLKLIDTLRKQGHDYITRPSTSSRLYKNCGWDGIPEYLCISLIEKIGWPHILEESKLPIWKKFGNEYRKDSTNQFFEPLIGRFSECTFNSVGYIIEYLGAKADILVATKPEILMPAVNQAFGKLPEYEMPKKKEDRLILFEELLKNKDDKPFIVIK